MRAYPKFKLSLLAYLVMASSIAYAQQDVQFVEEGNSTGVAVEESNLVSTFDEPVEFSSSLLRGDASGGKIDVSRFSRGDAIPAGEYEADIFVNGQPRGIGKLVYVERGNDTVLCLTPTLRALFDLKAEAYKEETQAVDGCLSVADAVRGHHRFQLGSFRFDLTLPQALVEQRPRGYISPLQWQEGVPVGFVNYDVNHYHFHTERGNKTEQTYIGINAGVNLFGWALRHNGSASISKSNYREDEKSRYTSNDIYARRGIAALRGEVTIGDFSTGGQLAEGVSLRGISVNSDDRMLPYSQRGYAPVIQGIANSNAKVTVRQAGSIIYQITVPAGPFVINDLYPSGYVGDLDVEILESNGQTRTFKVPYATVAQLIRQGHWRYQTALGYYRYGRYVSREVIAQGSLQYGLTNNLSLNTATSLNRNYYSILGGMAFNTPIGAFSSDVTYAVAKLPNRETQKGYSLYASYSVTVPKTETGLTLAAYRYSSRDFYSLRDTIWYNERGDLYLDNLEILSSRPKNQFQVVLNQRLGEDWGAFYLSGTSSTYWNSQAKLNQYQISYSNRYKLLGYNLGYSHAYNTKDKITDKRYYLSLSMPLGKSQHAPYLSSSISSGSDDNYSLSNVISGSFGEFNQWNYSLMASRAKQSANAYAANIGYEHPYASLQSSYGVDSRNNRQGSFSVSGAVVAHPKGITLSKNIGDSFAIVHAKGATGASLSGALGTKIDRFGNAILPYLSPYESNSVSIDPEGIPLNVELSATQQEVIPRANSAVLVNFEAKRSAMILFDVTLADGGVPPMATEAVDENGRSIGYVVQGGRLFANNLTNTQGKLTIRWGEGNSESCSFDYNLPDLNQENIKDIKIYNAVCR